MTTPTLSNCDVHKLLAEQRKVACIWCVTDVLDLRPDLSEAEAWDVLQDAERRHSTVLSWEVLRDVAEQLFPQQERVGDDHA
jgi:hypothetical protein